MMRTTEEIMAGEINDTLLPSTEDDIKSIGEEEGKLAKMQKRNQVFIAFSGGLMAMSVGSSIALSSSLIPQVVEEEIAQDFAEASWLATGYLYAGIPACLIGGFISDLAGRRLLALLCCPLLLTGWIFICSAHSLPILMVGRVITAFGAWLCYPSAHVLISESVHPSVRGYLGVFTSIFLALGMLESYLLGFLFHWRTMCFILSAQPVVMAVALFFVRESPYWLASKGKLEEAAASLQWSRGPNFDIQPELEEILKRREEQKSAKGSKEMSEIILSKPFLRGIGIAGMLFFLNQFTGISSLVVYMTSIFKESGLTLNPRLAPAIIGAVRVTTACCSSAALRTGNRLYIYCSCSTILSICCFIMASFSYWKSSFLEVHDIFGLVPLLIAIVMFIAHAFGINPVLHLLTGEIFPTKVRSLGSSLTLCLAMCGSAANSTCYPILQRSIGFSGVFWFYSGASLVMAVYAYLVIPDNRGLSLVKIEREAAK